MMRVPGYAVAALLFVAAAQPSMAQCLKHLEIPGVKGNGYDEIHFKVLRDGKAVAGATVNLYAKKRIVARFVTDSDGRFTLSDYAVGRYRLSIHGWGDASLVVKNANEVRFAVDGFQLKESNGCYQLVAL